MKTLSSALLPWWEEELRQREALPPGKEMGENVALPSPRRGQMERPR